MEIMIPNTGIRSLIRENSKFTSYILACQVGQEQEQKCKQ